MSELDIAVGISITNQCYQCQLLETQCPDCDESRIAKDATIAHELVDDRNIIYPNQWHNQDLTDSAWASSETIVGRARRKAVLTEREVRDPVTYEPHLEISLTWQEPESEWQIRNEFAPPITNLADRLAGYWFLGQHIMPMISKSDLLYRLQLGKNEAICQFCNLTYNTQVGCNNY